MDAIVKTHRSTFQLKKNLNVVNECEQEWFLIKLWMNIAGSVDWAHIEDAKFNKNWKLALK